MAKYVFDFELIDATIKVIKEKSANMSNTMNTYSSKLDSSTSSWKSDTYQNWTHYYSRYSVLPEYQHRR